MYADKFRAFKVTNFINTHKFTLTHLIHNVHLLRFFIVDGITVGFTKNASSSPLAAMLVLASDPGDSAVFIFFTCCGFMRFTATK